MMQPRKHDQQKSIALKKIIFLGDAQTGKSNLIACIEEDKPIIGDCYRATIGMDFKVCTIGQIKLQIWDTAGQERFWNNKTWHLVAPHCIVIFYDVTNDDSFRHIPFWIEKSKSFDTRNAPIYLIGTKTDLISDRRITSEEGEEFAKSLPKCIGWAEVSSKENFNVSHALQQLTSIIAKDDLAYHQQEQIKESEQRALNRYNQLSDNQKQYVSQLQLIWNETSKKLKNMSKDNIQLTLIKSVLDYYSKNDNILSLLFSPNSWASHHTTAVNTISHSIITNNPTPHEIIERLERLNPVATGDVASIIYFLKEKFNFSADNEENKKVNIKIKYRFY